MIGYALFLLVAVIWLVHRLLSIYKIPINSLIQILNIKIPKVPIVSINKIASDHVCFHWEPTLEKGAGNQYKIYLNGVESMYWQVPYIYIFVTALLTLNSIVVLLTRSQLEWQTIIK